MGKAKYYWWPHVKRIIELYPQRNREWEALKSVPITPNYEAVGHGSGISNPTELTAIRELPGIAQREFEAVRYAVSETAYQPDGEHRLMLIRLVYWRQSHTLHGAAMHVGISYATAKRWHRRFMLLVADKYGFGK